MKLMILGFDLKANVSENIEIKPGQTEVIPTGLAVSIPKNSKFKLDLDLDWLQKIKLLF